MERLSEKLKSVIDECINAWSQIEEDACNAAIQRLAYYEDLEEQGRLVVPPCKVGDTVYRKLTLNYQKETVTVIGIDNEGIYIGTTCGTYQKHHLGKTVFLTYEEAENAMKEDV